MADARELALEGARKWVQEHPDEFREAVERGERDLKFALEHMQEWRRKYPNRWVAVAGGKLACTDTNFDGLLASLREKGIDPVDADVFFVHDEHISLAIQAVIPGSYSLPSGAFIRGFVYFPAPVDQFLPVRFLVDTGAAQSFASLSDLSRFEPRVRARIPVVPGGGIRGVGDTLPSFATAASLIFGHDDGDATMFGLRLALLMDVRTLDLPSVLGRDILFHGPLHFEPAGGAVYFDPPKGSFLL